MCSSNSCVWALTAKVLCFEKGSNIMGSHRLSPPDSSVHEIAQARILEWLAVPFSRESSRPRDWTPVSQLWADSLPSEPPLKPIKVKWALRVEHSSNRFSVFRKGNTREFSLCLCVFSSISFPNPPTLCEDTGRSQPGKKEFLPEPHLAGTLIWDF